MKTNAKVNNTVTTTKILTNGFKCFTTFEKKNSQCTCHGYSHVHHLQSDKTDSQKNNDYDFLCHFRRALTVKHKWLFIVTLIKKWIAYLHSKVDTNSEQVSNFWDGISFALPVLKLDQYTVIRIFIFLCFLNSITIYYKHCSRKNFAVKEGTVIISNHLIGDKRQTKFYSLKFDWLTHWQTSVVVMTIDNMIYLNFYWRR